jgi:hemoglobin/transferrin/lactoferrin receptor protein
MKHEFLVLLCLFFSYQFQAQQLKVLDNNFKTPVSGVTITNSNKTKTVVTNLNGEANIDLFLDNESLHFISPYYEFKVLNKSAIISNNFIVFLEIKTENLKEVVISASKFMQSKKDIPQKIIEISAQDISLSNPQTSADLLLNSGNVYLQKSQLGGGSPMIRGFSANRLLITVDGVRMNNAIFRGGNLQNVISIDPFTIQKTEITLGAGSVIYGSDAVGGVMSFYTQKPQLSYKDSLYFKANAIMRYATANSEKTGHIDFNFGLKNLAFLSSISYSDFDDLRMGNHGPDDYLRPEYVKTENGVDMIIENENPLIQKPTGYDQINFMQKVRYEPEVNLTMDLGLFYSSTSEYSRYDRLIRYNGNELHSAEWNYGPQRWFMGNFQLTKLNSNSNLYDKIQFTAAYQNFQESRFDRDFQSEIRNIREETVDALSFNIDLEKQLSPKTELFYGFEYLYNKVNSSGNEENISANTSVPTVSRYPDGSDWQSIAAYTSIKYKPSPKFIFQSGLRYNHVLINADFTENNQYLNLPFDKANINVGSFTGTAGISWLPSEMVQWKLNASTAFRAPNIDDVGKVFDSEPGSVVVPNNNLKPEYAYGGELGLKLDFDKVFILDMTTYYTFLDDALVRRGYSLNGQTEIIYDGELSTVQAIQNASKAWIYGFEVGIQINFSDTFKLTSQYNIIGGTEEENDIEVPPRHAAPNFGNTHLVYKKNKFLIDVFAEYNSELSYYQLAPSEIEKDFIYALDSYGNPYAPSWHTVNFRTQYQLTNAATITASLENITDQRYKTYSSGIASTGRNFIISLKYTL